MTKRNFLIWMLILAVVTILTIPYAWYLLKVIFAGGNILNQLEIFKWVSIGFVVFAILRRYIKGNLEFAETFSHELTHLIVAGIVNRELYEMHVKRQSGVVWTAGKNEGLRLMISLAPYCFPLFTFILLSFRWMMNFHGIWIFDIIIGCTLCFHFHCFKTQIGNHQPDINRYPLLLSYSYIATSWLLVFCIIVPAFFPNMNGHGTVEPMYNYGVFSSMWRLLEAWWGNFASILHIS